jgi:hypothetical protein
MMVLARLAISILQARHKLTASVDDRISRRRRRRDPRHIAVPREAVTPGPADDDRQRLALALCASSTTTQPAMITAERA